MKWDFFVHHFADRSLRQRDPKYYETWDGKPVDGVLYPRAGTLGGCTAHNAMILVYPHNADWDYIAQLTGDASWSAGKMRRYFELLENCHHRPLHRWLSKIGINLTRHGWHGWLHTEKSIPMAVVRNRALEATIVKSALEAFLEDGRQEERVRWALEGAFDPNDWRLVRQNAVGTRYLPLTTQGHRRFGSRERVLDVARRYPDRLRIVTNALACRVILDSEQPGDRCGVPAGRASVPGTRQAERCGGRASYRSCVARSHSGRRRVQLPATADAFRHRTAGGARTPRHSGARGAAGGREEPAGSLRNRRGEPDEVRGVGRVQGRHIRRRRSAIQRMEEPAARAYTPRTARC